MSTSLYIQLRKHEGRWSPRTAGIDASTDHYRDLIAHGWLPENAWTSTEVRSDCHRLAPVLLPIRHWPNPLIDRLWN